MSRKLHIPVWKTAPFTRLLTAFAAGIILQWRQQYDYPVIFLSLGCFALCVFTFQLLPLAVRFRLQVVQGIAITLFLVATGAAVMWQKDIRHRYDWFGHNYQKSNYLVMTINEPLVEKTKSLKTDGRVNAIITEDSTVMVSGYAIIYFQKGSSAASLQYGDEILLKKPLQSIRNSGNPGAFDYVRYAASMQLFHTVYLKEGDWILLKEKDRNPFKAFIYNTRQHILSILQRHIKGHDAELAIAEALLIGYTQDLDKDLVQAYSNTGVVHIIAISGLHLGLIYFMIAWLYDRIPYLKRIKILKVIIVLSSLWLFSLLTGGSASVLRSAVMFTCIVAGGLFAKRASIYNSLAASAFILLCYDPGFLWDVGFQLSYLAVLGIVIFQRPIYHLFYIRNKAFNKIWELAAVSLAAQVLTFPVCLYYFHQFPNTFLITNLVMVPLSSIILFVEIFLVAFAWIPVVGLIAGRLTYWLILGMNKFILWFNALPFALWKNIPASLLFTFLLYAFIFCVGGWLLNKSMPAFKGALLTLFLISIERGTDKWRIINQRKLVIYNINQHMAIDMIRGRQYHFIGDTSLLKENALYNLNLKPARTNFQLSAKEDVPVYPVGNNTLFFYQGKKIILVKGKPSFSLQDTPVDIDLAIISGNPPLDIRTFASVFNCRCYVFDGSNSLWKIGKWERACEELHLRFYSIPRQGAFIMDL